jgi:predicted nucleic acid-binding protein
VPRRVYWDSCCFLGLLNQEAGKASDCAAVWDEAQQGKTVIYTSFFTFTEVIRAKCEGELKPLQEADDAKIQAFLNQSWIKTLVLDERIALTARTLLRLHTECKKPTDGIHLATALSMNVEEMHTYDGSDLLKLSGKVQRADGKPQIICIPKPKPSPSGPGTNISLFVE